MGRKWMNIKEKKAKADRDTSRVYAKFGIEIYAAAKSGEPDPELNQKLKFVVERAKTYNVPRHVIEKAIDKAKGGDDENFQDLRYEGFGPNGSMVIVDALTNNVNRTASDVRAAYGKNGGNMGVSGSVSYMFESTAVFVFEHADAEEIMMVLLEADVDMREVNQEGNQVVVLGEPSEFEHIRQVLEDNGITEFEVAEIDLTPQSEVVLTGDDLKQFERLIDVLESNEDVQRVYHNVDLEEE